MGEWKAIDTAPRDGTWVKVQGWDFGIIGSRRHYATAFYENGCWFEVGSNGSQLRYLTDWQELSGTSSDGDDEALSMQEKKPGPQGMQRTQQAGDGAYAGRLQTRFRQRWLAPLMIQCLLERGSGSIRQMRRIIINGWP
jgi:hypothetical protein